MSYSIGCGTIFLVASPAYRLRKTGHQKSVFPIVPSTQIMHKKRYTTKQTIDSQMLRDTAWKLLEESRNENETFGNRTFKARNTKQAERSANKESDVPN